MDLLSDPSIDVIAISTPVSTHYELAIEALQSGKHVLVEKPLALTSREATLLIEEASRRGLILMVDHTFVYTSAVRKIREVIHNGQIGQVYYYDSVRVNLGLFHHDVNVIWDLAVHDISIMDYVLPMRPCAVSATGVSHVAGSTENIAYLTLFYENNVIAHIHANWLSPVKIRRTLIGGSQKMIVYDELEPSDKIKVYDKGITVNDHSETGYQLRIGYRAGDMWAPQLAVSEALQNEAVELIAAVESKRRPVTDGEAGLRVIQVLEAASKSLRERGRPVEVEARKVAW
jgi:predicted dehydrogenase